MAFDAKTFITNARAKGIPDSATYQYLQGKGLIGQPKTQTPTTPTSFWGSLLQSQMPGNIGLNSPVGDIAMGVGKSVIGTLGETSKLGEKIMGGIGSIPGLGFLKPKPGENPLADKMVSASQPSNMAQTVGKVAGDVGQFFIPGSTEAKVGEAAEKGIEALGLGEEAAGALKIGAKALTTGASMGAVTAAQTGGDIKATTESAVTGGIAGGVGKALEIVSPGIASALEKASFKLSPAKATQLGQKADQAASFISDNKIMGTTAGKAAKLDTITTQMESAIQSSIPDATVPKSDLITQLNSIPDQFKGDPATYQKVKSDVASAITTLQETQPENVSLDDVLSSKRSYGRAAYNKDGSAMIKESKAAISNVFYSAIDNKMVSSGDTIKIPQNLQRYFGGSTEMSLKDFNATYSKAVKASQLTDAATNKKDMGLVTRLLMVGIGSAIGGEKGGVPGALMGGVMGYAGEELGSSGITSGARTMFGQGLQTAATTIPAAAKIGFPLLNQNGSSPQNQQ